MIQTDIAIIGAGPGGYIAALRARQLGARVVVIERERIGGVCLNWGCIPTKALLHSAEALEMARGARRFGVRTGEVSYDWAAVQAHKERVVAQLVGGVSKLLSRAGAQVLTGEARFVRERTLRVASPAGDETVEAETIIIATGSRTLVVPVPGLDDPGILDSTTVLALERLPASLCIIGSGAIGTEFASLLATFGVQVTLVEMLPRIAPLMDHSVSDGLAWSLERRGVDIKTGARVTQVERLASGYRTTLQTATGAETVETERVLSAIGRAPNVEHLGLETIGLQPTRKGIQVDARLRTAAPGVYAIGDVAAEGPMLAHVATHQGIVAVEDAMALPARMDYDAVPSCIFSLPEAASVGLTEEQVRERHGEALTGVFALVNNGKALAMGETEGFVKVVAEPRHGAVLGVHIVGPHASDLILQGVLGLQLELTLDEWTHTIQPHPTLGEALGEAALLALKRPLAVPS
ncbi:MAG: dihydrolipoyl dehydrogenase [Anaerolineae bacterium]|jgi:dihydrolipoamide dehydrogenase